jgi:serine/threonine protein kinase
MNPRYIREHEIGRGGVGVVYKAWDSKLQRHVAIKTLLAEPEMLMDLEREAAITAAMNHPHVVAIHDVMTENDGELSIIMEYLNGETLDVIGKQTRLTYDDFAVMAEHALEGLAAAHHAGLIHRDIKPSNIMTHFLPDGTINVKVLDFGLGKIAHRPVQQTTRQDGSVYGSIYSMSPEQLRNDPMDNRSDLYSLGCVYYFALTSHHPHEGKTMADVINGHLDKPPVRLKIKRNDLPKPMCDWVHWLMEKDMNKRPADAVTALQVLRGVLSGEITDFPAYMKEFGDTLNRVDRPGTGRVRPVRKTTGGVMPVDDKISRQTKNYLAIGLATLGTAAVITAFAFLLKSQKEASAKKSSAPIEQVAPEVK